MPGVPPAVHITAQILDVRFDTEDPGLTGRAIDALTPAEVRAIARRVYDMLAQDMHTQRARRGWVRR